MEVDLPVPPAVAPPPQGQPDFDGASMAAQSLVIELHACSFCEAEYPKGFASWLAYVEVAPPHPFAEIADANFEKAKQRLDGKAAKLNHAYEAPVRTCCFKCGERIHNVNYTIEGSKPPKPNSQWLKGSRKSKGQLMSKSRVAWVAREMDRKKEGSGVKLQDLYEASKVKMVLSASDWVVELGPEDDAFLWIVYTCPDEDCLVAPTRSNSWLRMQSDARDETEGMTSTANGHWRCNACFKKWGWRDGGSKRLVITGEATLGGGFKDYEYAYLGDNSEKLNAKIHVLKIARILRMVNGVEMTKERLMKIISTMNDRIAAKFSKGVREVRRVQGKVPTAEEISWTGAHLVCEDRRLSLPSYGMDFQAIDLKLCNQSLAPIDVDEMHFYLDACAAGLDIENVRVKGDTHKEAKTSILGSLAFKETRTRLSQL
jgi:hypothetical protein